MMDDAISTLKITHLILLRNVSVIHLNSSFNLFFYSFQSKPSLTTCLLYNIESTKRSRIFCISSY